MTVGITELPPEGMQLPGVALAGDAERGTKTTEGISLLFTTAGITVQGPQPQIERLLVWSALDSATCREKIQLTDGREAAIMELTSGGQSIRFLLPTDTVSPGQAAYLDQALPTWLARYKGSAVTAPPAPRPDASAPAGPEVGVALPAPGEPVQRPAGPGTWPRPRRSTPAPPLAGRRRRSPRRASPPPGSPPAVRPPPGRPAGHGQRFRHRPGGRRSGIAPTARAGPPAAATRPLRPRPRPTPAGAPRPGRTAGRGAPAPGPLPSRPLRLRPPPRGARSTATPTGAATSGGPGPVRRLGRPPARRGPDGPRRPEGQAVPARPVRQVRSRPGRRGRGRRAPWRPTPHGAPDAGHPGRRRGDRRGRRAQAVVVHADPQAQRRKAPKTPEATEAAAGHRGRRQSRGRGCHLRLPASPRPATGAPADGAEPSRFTLTRRSQDGRGGRRRRRRRQRPPPRRPPARRIPVAAPWADPAPMAPPSDPVPLAVQPPPPPTTAAAPAAPPTTAADRRRDRPGSGPVGPRARTARGTPDVVIARAGEALAVAGR